MATLSMLPRTPGGGRMKMSTSSRLCSHSYTVWPSCTKALRSGPEPGAASIADGSSAGDSTGGGGGRDLAADADADADAGADAGAGAGAGAGAVTADGGAGAVMEPASSRS